MIRHFATAVAIALALLLLWAPLPFGSVTRPGALLVQGLSFALFALAAFTARRRDLRVVMAPVGALAAVALFGALQSLSWPRFLVAAVSPLHAALAAEGAFVPLSLAPEASLRTALLWAAAACALAAAAVAARRRDRRRWLGAAVVAAALFQVVYGAGRWLARATSIWSVPVPGDPSRLRGTFVNPDHLALYLEIALALVFAWGWWSFRRARYEPSSDHRLLLTVPPLAVWLTLFVGLAFTGSRGGLLAAVVAVVGQGALIAAAERRGRRGRLLPVGALAALAGLGVVALVGFQEGFGRLASTSAYEVTWNHRVQVYGATWELWQRSPLLGVGLGAFRDALPLNQPDGLRGSWWHAHSDWLELLATTGALGLLLLLLGLAALLAHLTRGWLADRRSEDRAAVLAALGAMVSLAIHEAVDFGLTMPASFLTLAALAGVAAVAAGTGEVQALDGTLVSAPAALPAPEPSRHQKSPPPRSGGGRRRRRARH